jgi:steroid 5-alpha reductase family enzyme
MASMKEKAMFSWPIYGYSLAAIGLFALWGWLFSLARKNVTHVDSMWSLFFVIATFSSCMLMRQPTTRMLLVLALVTIWALRLFIYLTWRNWGPHEDSRYVQIRENNQPHFWLKSLYLVFGLQAILAWLISVSLFGAVTSHAAINSLDYLGIALFVFGFVWESVADWQLSRFKANPINKGKVLNSGLWRYSRHPNYFGECCVWWAFYLFALAGGAWWAIISPILMTLLLLKVSGVSLLESTIVERRPAYADYIKNTNAFFPSLPKG